MSHRSDEDADRIACPLGGICQHLRIRKQGFVVGRVNAPSVYYPIVCAGLSDEQIRVMEEENALPHGWENMAYEDFLIERRKLMAAKIKAAFEILKKAAT